MRPIRVSRRLALGGAAATGAVLLAGSALAQSGASAPSSSPRVPSPDDEPTIQTWEAPVFEDVLIERSVGPAGVAYAAGPVMAPFDVKGGPFAFRALPLSAETLKEQLAGARTDRDFANGKMDLTHVNALLASAETLIGQAEAKQPAQPTATTESPRPGMIIRKIGPLALSREARLAAAQIHAAVAQMEAGLGGVLPSQARRIGHELTMAHRVVAETTALTRNSPEASGLVGQAQALYKQAYDAYQGGQYDRAGASARAALATAETARLTVEPEPVKPSSTPAAPPPPTF